jgi:iron complex transport system substrate-binding protein
MSHPRLPLVLVALTGVALVTSACASSEPAADTQEAAAETVTVADAKPTLVLVEEDGESSYQEDPEADRGSVEVPYQPEAVVTFDIATLDTLDAIGAGDAVVGIPDIALPDYLSDYADLPKVGSLFEPDFEAVA